MLTRWLLFFSLATAGCGAPSGDDDFGTALQDAGSGTDGAADPCATVRCSTPPATACLDTATLRSYARSGTCAAGSCDYNHTDTICANGCSGGACVGNDPCAGVVCNTPPAPSCTGTTTVRTYSPSGTCSNGSCSYASTDSGCPKPTHGVAACGAGGCGFYCVTDYEPSGSSCVAVSKPNWSVQTINSTYQFYGVWGSGPNDVYAVGRDTTKNAALIYHFDGTTWSPQTTGAPANSKLVAVWGSGPNNVYAVGVGNIANAMSLILHSIDGGMSWSSESTNTTDMLISVWGSGAGNVYVGGIGGSDLHSTNQGVSWPALSFGGATIYGEGIWGSGADDVYLVDAHSILHTVDSGVTFTVAAQPYTLKGAWGSGPGDVYVVGSAGVIVHSRSTLWDTQNSGTTSDLTAIWGSGAGDIYVVGVGGTICHTANAGKTAWGTQTSGTSNDLYGIWGSGADDIYVVGVGGTILHGTP